MEEKRTDLCRELSSIMVRIDFTFHGLAHFLIGIHFFHFSFIEQDLCGKVRSLCAESWHKMRRACPYAPDHSRKRPLAQLSHP